jgi:hypothetical protein
MNGAGATRSPARFCAGQAMAEVLLGVALVAAALLMPWVGGESVAGLLWRALLGSIVAFARAIAVA